MFQKSAAIVCYCQYCDRSIEVDRQKCVFWTFPSLQSRSRIQLVGFCGHPSIGPFRLHSGCYGKPKPKKNSLGFSASNMDSDPKFSFSLKLATHLFKCHWLVSWNQMVFLLYKLTNSNTKSRHSNLRSFSLWDSWAQVESFDVNGASRPPIEWEDDFLVTLCAKPCIVELLKRVPSHPSLSPRFLHFCLQPLWPKRIQTVCLPKNSTDVACPGLDQLPWHEPWGAHLWRWPILWKWPNGGLALLLQGASNGQ